MSMPSSSGANSVISLVLPSTTRWPSTTPPACSSAASRCTARPSPTRAPRAVLPSIAIARHRRPGQFDGSAVPAREASQLQIVRSSRCGSMACSTAETPTRSAILRSLWSERITEMSAADTSDQDKTRITPRPTRHAHLRRLRVRKTTHTKPTRNGEEPKRMIRTPEQRVGPGVGPPRPLTRPTSISVRANERAGPAPAPSTRRRARCRCPARCGRPGCAVSAPCRPAERGRALGTPSTR